MAQIRTLAPAPRSSTQAVARIGSIVAATILVAIGLVVTSTGIAFTVADGFLASGRPAVDPADRAIFEAILPYWALFVLAGSVLIVGGVGAVDRGPLGRGMALVAAGMVLVPAVAVQLGGATGSIDLDATGRAVAAVFSGLAGVAVLGVVASARR